MGVPRHDSDVIRHDISREKNEIPPGACRHIKNAVKNNVEKENHQQVEKNNVEKVDPQKVEKKQC